MNFKDSLFFAFEINGFLCNSIGLRRFFQRMFEKHVFKVLTFPKFQDFQYAWARAAAARADLNRCDKGNRHAGGDGRAQNEEGPLALRLSELKPKWPRREERGARKEEQGRRVREERAGRGGRGSREASRGGGGGRREERGRGRREEG